MPGTGLDTGAPTATAGAGADGGGAYLSIITEWYICVGTGAPTATAGGAADGGGVGRRTYLSNITEWYICVGHARYRARYLRTYCHRGCCY